LKIRIQIWKMTKHVNAEELSYFKNMLEACVPGKKMPKLPPASYSEVYSEAPTIQFNAIREDETTPVKIEGIKKE